MLSLKTVYVMFLLCYENNSVHSSDLGSMDEKHGFLLNSFSTVIKCLWHDYFIFQALHK